MFLFDPYHGVVLIGHKIFIFAVVDNPQNVSVLYLMVQ